ncbi:TetR/AcrR family transcriptional regulator [Pyruvatibacter mobilis]|uniref:TetR/AcrR family transcriptional regulator n=1 Tax=Pyruvatibacter mobilis TaxID=1712261 RepID=UPI003BAEA8A1
MPDSRSFSRDLPVDTATDHRNDQRGDHRGELRSSKDTKKRIAILDAVVRLIAEGGAKFTELSVSDIVQAAGVSRSTFYLHFSDKTGLIELLIDKLEEDLVEAAGLTNEVFYAESESSTRESLINLALYVRHNLRLFSAVYEVVATDPAIERRYHNMIRATVYQRRRTLADEKASGRVDPDTANFVPMALTWMVERTITQHVTAATKEDIVSDPAAMAMIDGLAQIILRSMRPQG